MSKDQVDQECESINDNVWLKNVCHFYYFKNQSRRISKMVKISVLKSAVSTDFAESQMDQPSDALNYFVSKESRTMDEAY